MTRPTYSRRAVVIAGAIITAGCVGGSDGGSTGGSGDSGGDDPDEDVDFQSDEVEATADLSVSDQEGDGTMLDIDSASATVDYYLVIEYGGNTIESEPIDAGQSVSPTIDLSPRIQTDESVTVSVYSTNDEELASATIEYRFKPPGPELTEEEAQAIAEDQQRPIFEDWHEPGIVVGHIGDAYDVELNYLSRRRGRSLNYNREERTEAGVCRLNARYLRAFFESDYHVGRVTILAWLDSDIDASGNRTYDIANTTVMTRETAEEINWDSFINDIDPWENLPEVADEYRWQWYEDPT